MVVIDKVETVSTTKYIEKDDILIAVNGKCFGSIGIDISLESWKNLFTSISYPKILTFFRLDKNGDLLLNPQRVFFISSLDSRLF